MVTKREIGLCVIIVLVMSLLGYVFYGLIQTDNDKRNAQIFLADRIYSADAFEYAVKTDVGDMLSEGVLTTNKPVTFENIEGDYIYIRRESEHYTQHTRQVAHAHTDSKGRTYTTYTTEVYYTWDYVTHKSKSTKTLRFLNQEFGYKEIRLPTSHYLDTEYVGAYDRYVYYGVENGRKGVLICKTDDTPNFKIVNASFKSGYTIESLIDHYEDTAKTSKGLFIFFWCLLTGFACYGFCYLENWWLND